MTHIHDLLFTLPTTAEVDCETCKSLLWLLRQHIAETPPTYAPDVLIPEDPTYEAPPTYVPVEDQSGMGLNLKPRPITEAVHAAFNHGDSLHAHYDEVTGEALKGGLDAEDLATLSLEPQDVDPADLRDTAEIPAVSSDPQANYDIPLPPPGRRTDPYAYGGQRGSEAGCYS